MTLAAEVDPMTVVKVIVGDSDNVALRSSIRAC
jgi:hypothetical protein